jgi:hypothetical protein
MAIGAVEGDTAILNVLISEEFLQEPIRQIIEDVIKGKWSLRAVTSTYADEIHRQSEETKFALFVLFLNNIIFPKDNFPSEHRFYKALRMVSQLKTRYKRPIIAFYGRPDGLEYGEKAKLAGADFVMRAPCGVSEIREAIEECLSPLLK